MISVGIDIGSITAKAAIVNHNKLVGTHLTATGYQASTAGRRVFNEILEKFEFSEKDVKSVVATGYGRKSVDFAEKQITEILCHGAGACFLNPEIKGIIDVGGQDSKAIALNSRGEVDNFAMNDKCAAGTGRFLEVMARVMEVDLEDMGDISLTASSPSKISSICTVFAESEVISMISSGQHKRNNIIAGIHESAAARIAILALKIKIQAPVMMTGGVAKNIGMVKALENRLGLHIEVNPSAQENGAIGAAVLAAKL